MVIPINKIGACALLLLLVPRALMAQTVEVVIGESGNDAVVEWSGKITSLNGLNFLQQASFAYGDFGDLWMMNGVGMYIHAGSEPLNDMYTVDTAAGGTFQTNFPGNGVMDDTVMAKPGTVGGMFGFLPFRRLQGVVLPRDYTLGSELSGTITIPGTGLEALLGSRSDSDGTIGQATWNVGGKEGEQKMIFRIVVGGAVEPTIDTGAPSLSPSASPQPSGVPSLMPSASPQPSDIPSLVPSSIPSSLPLETVELEQPLLRKRA